MSNDGYFIGGKSGGGVTEEELNQALAGKSDDGHTHTYSEVTDKPTIPTNNTELANGAGYIDGTYDNTTSGLTATDIQAAIDELKALIDASGA